MAIQKAVITQCGAPASHHHVGRILVDLMADPPTLSVWLVSYYDTASFLAGRGKMGDYEHRIELGTEEGQLDLPLRGDLMRHVHRFLLTLPEWTGAKAVGLEDPLSGVVPEVSPEVPLKKPRKSRAQT